MIKDLLVLGAGTAGLLAALTVRKKLPRVRVRIVRSPEIGVVGVGESTTPNVPTFLFDYLGIDRRQFFQQAEPTWKLGVHFLWGPRPCFEYPFVAQLDTRHIKLPRPFGYYCDDDFSATNESSALMTAGKAFSRRPDGSPNMLPGHAFHLENQKLVKTLELAATHCGIEFINGTLAGVEQNDAGITAITLEDGQTLHADFFIDASGFRSELLGRALGEPFISFGKSLFNDRAILGGWERGDEPILPYTTAETMDAGWAWRIDHEHHINRGYVYCSSHISDDQARREFAEKNPKARINDRIVKFKCGRYERTWVKNVMAIGNAAAFVEPLEATSLMMICWQCQSFEEFIQHVGPTAGVRDLFNQISASAWDEIRDFLTLHFKANTRLDTPYWKHCRADADSSRLQELLQFYYDSGPTGFARYKLNNRESQFGVEGYLVQLVGNKVPYRNRHAATSAELNLMHQVRQNNRVAAMRGFTVAECLGFIRHPAWRWYYETQGVAAAR